MCPWAGGTQEPIASPRASALGFPKARKGGNHARRREARMRDALRARADAPVGREDLYPGCFQGETPGDGRNAFREHKTGPFKPFLLKLPPKKKSLAGKGRANSMHRPTGEQCKNGLILPSPPLPCIPSMQHQNRHNTLTFPVAPKTVHLGGIGTGLHLGGRRGCRCFGSEALR